MTSPALGPGAEFDRIRRLLEGAPPLPAGVRVGPGDDAAVLEPDLVVSTDLAVEGVHFRLDWIGAAEAGARAAAAAMSDLAAMGAHLVGGLASAALPGGSHDEAFLEGIRRELEAHGGALLGGDLARSSGPLLVDLTVIGRADAPLLRSGARAGDELWVTGTLGGAAAAVALWRDGRTPPAELRRAYARPIPRLGPARWLVDAGARAGLDLSDGIAGDAGHLAAASGAGVVLRADTLPLHPALVAAGTDVDALDLALHGGDDFELLVAVPPGALSPGRVEEFARIFDLALSRVGEVVAGTGVRLVPKGGGAPRPLERGGYDHFGSERAR